MEITLERSSARGTSNSGANSVTDSQAEGGQDKVDQINLGVTEGHQDTGQ